MRNQLRGKIRKPRKTVSRTKRMAISLERAKLARMPEKKPLTTKRKESLIAIALDKERNEQEVDDYARKHRISRNEAKRKLGRKKRK